MTRSSYVDNAKPEEALTAKLSVHDGQKFVCFFNNIDMER